MASSGLPFFIITFLSISINLLPTTAQLSPDGDFNFCNDNYGNYTPNSPYNTNLDLVFSNFSSLSTAQFNGGFYNFSAGVSSDRVNTIGLCRGDLQASDCHDCLHNIKTDLVKQCPNQKEAIKWYYNCMFRYSNRSIVGVMDNTTKIMTATGVNATSASGANEFELALGNLVNKLTSVAASGGSVRKFATGNVSVQPYVYALVQCTPDLGQLDCESCLFGAFDDVQFTFAGKVEAAVFLPSCHLRYGNETFYGPGLRAPPPPAPVRPESTPTVTSGTGATGHAFKILVAPTVVAALVQLLIFVGLLIKLCTIFMD